MTPAAQRTKKELADQCKWLTERIIYHQIQLQNLKAEREHIREELKTLEQKESGDAT